jgi:hypothetical protein
MPSSNMTTMVKVPVSSIALDSVRAVGSVASKSHDANLVVCRSKMDLWTLYTDGIKLTRAEPSSNQN